MGEAGALSLYTWDWNEIAGKALNLFGSSEGVLAQEVINQKPCAVVVDESGYYKVNYGVL